MSALDSHQGNAMTRARKKIRSLFAIGTCLLLLSTTPSYAQQDSLYDRLGGYTAISAVVDVFADRLFADPRINDFFVGMGTDTRNSFKQKNKNLVCNVTGGPCKVISRPAAVVHDGLGITEGDFNVVAGHLKATLDQFNVPEQEQDDLFAIILTLKPQIVERDTTELSKDLD